VTWPRQVKCWRWFIRKNMRVHYSFCAGNPYLSLGKSGRLIEKELGAICDLVPAKEARPSDLQIYLGIPYWIQRDKFARLTDRFVWFTMWENDTIPSALLRRMEGAAGMITPCQWCDDLFRAHGVTAPNFVVPLGIDTDRYKPLTRPKKDAFTFLWVGTSAGHVDQFKYERKKRFGDRKRGWLVRQAFQELDLPNSRLILKQMPWPSGIMNINYRTPSGNAHLWHLAKWLTEAQLIDVYREADCFVWPTWGEGFGLPPLECAATGIPAILPNFSALESYFDPSWCIELPYTIGNVWAHKGYAGAKIDLEDLKEKMLWAYENREQVREMGRAASKVAETWDWRDRTRPALKRVIDYYKEVA